MKIMSIPDGLLNNFLVKLFSDMDSTSEGIKLCGQYDGEFLEPGNPMRVNCDVYSNYDVPMIMVGIFPNDYQKTVSKKSAISEISIRLLGVWTMCLDKLRKYPVFLITF